MKIGSVTPEQFWSCRTIFSKPFAIKLSRSTKICAISIGKNILPLVHIFADYSLFIYELGYMNDEIECNL